jgi:hypothetical protein
MRAMSAMLTPSIVTVFPDTRFVRHPLLPPSCVAGALLQGSG